MTAPAELVEAMQEALTELVRSGGLLSDVPAAMLQALSQAGWVVVPREATEAQIAAATNAMFECYGGYDKETQLRMRVMAEPANRRLAGKAYAAYLSAMEKSGG